MTCWIFDVDDTLVEYVDFDFEEWYKFIAEPVAREMGVPLNLETWRAMLDGRISRKYPEKWGDWKKFWREVDRRNLEYRKMMFSQGRLKKNRGVEKISELRGIKIAWSASSKECVEYVLEKLGIADLFPAVFGKDYMDYKFIEDIKPRPGLLNEIRRIYGCEECYVIGDSERDMKAAEGANCKGIRVKDGNIEEIINSLISRQ